MAVSLANASVDYLQRTTGLLSAASDQTFSSWVYIPSAGGYGVTFYMGDDPLIYLNWIGIYIANLGGGTQSELNIGAGGVLLGNVTFANPTLDAWHYFTYTRSGTTHKAYIDGTVVATIAAVNWSTATYTHQLLGSDAYPVDAPKVAYAREWNVALTAAQILVEMQATAAVHTANLYMDCPFSDNLLDDSGNGHDWTQVGSVTYVTGPSFPSNSSAATATAFGSLPQTITQDFGDGLYAWYSYTGHTSEVMAGFFAYAAIPGDTITTTVYESDGATHFLLISGENKPIQVPQSSATLLYFKVSSGNTPPSTDVTFSAMPGPTTAVPVGAIFVNDDTTGFLTGVVDPTDGANYQVLQFFAMAVTTSENGGDVLENGRVLVGNDDDSSIRLYNGQLEQITSVAGVFYAKAIAIRTCVGAQVFYVGLGGGGAHSGTIYRVDADGLKTDTWTLPSAGITGVAASNDESIIYVTGQSSSINAPVKQWDPNTSTFGADLAAGVANHTTFDLLVTGDDSVLALYHRTSGGGSNLFINRYDAAGATLNTYTFTTTDSQASMFHALDDPNSFWVRVHDEVSVGTCTFYNIKASDGSFLATINQASYEGGTYQAAASTTPLARFGLSESCPSFILREAINPPTPGGEPTEYLIRRERWFPHLSSEQFRQFFLMLQIDLQAGNGLGGVPSTTQGFDPLLEIDWSDDGGWTWSNIHFVHTGKVGAYTQRAILRRMGYARDRTYRIACSDPNQWVIVNGYLQAILGTS